MDILKKVIFPIFIVIFLTILTQVGGIIWLMYKGILCLLEKKDKKWGRVGKSLFFGLIYLIISFLIVPSLAAIGGRVQLPLFDNVRPLTYFTIICNRHYVVPELAAVLKETAKKTQEKIYYLDAGFPFWDGFSLLPHLSHNDGRKVDVAFYYTHKFSSNIYEHPSNSGYGVFESPKEGEENMPSTCKKQGFWQYDFTKYVSFSIHHDDYTF